MSITYEEALSTLTSMFGAPWTKETLDAVLRHHEGHMENTVETVLSHGDGDPADLVERLKNPGSASEHVDVDEELARQLASESGRQRSAEGGTSQRATGVAPVSGPNGRKLRGTPTQLPPDFLRVPGRSADIDADEQLARMLQDELFTRELANNPEFAHLAGRGRGRGSSAGSGRGSATATGAGRGAGGGGWFSGAGRSGPTGSTFPGFGRAAAGRGAGGQQEGPNVMDNLKGMGDAARKRLTMFAQQFNERMNNPQGSAAASGAQSGSTGGMGGSSGAHERRGLLDGDGGTDDEVAFLGANDLDMEVNSPGGKKND